MTKRLILIVALLVVAIAAVVFWMRRPRENPNLLRVSGNIELTQVDIGFKTPGRISELNVNEGAPVKKGQVLAQLDAEQVRQQRSRDQAGVIAAESQLTQLKTSIQLQRETVSRDTELRRAELQAAEARLKELMAGSRKEEIQQARAATEDARSQYTQASADWERAQELYAREDISTQQRDQFRARFQSTGAALRQAEQRQALVVEGPRREEIDQARAQVERARAAVRLAEANRIEVTRREQELEARSAEIDRARAQLGVTETQLNDMVAASPIDGVVMVKVAERGEVVAAGAAVLTVGDIDRPWVRGFVSETQLARIRLGDSVKVTTDSFPGKTYNGRISFIASEAEFTPRQIQTSEERVKLVYRIKIDVENPNRELKSNMPVDAEITLREQ